MAGTHVRMSEERINGWEEKKLSPLYAKSGTNVCVQEFGGELQGAEKRWSLFFL